MQLIIDSKKNIKDYFCDYELEYNEYGKPYLKNNDFYFNKSYSYDLGILIINENECGVDIEKIHKYDDVMAKRILSACEYNFVNSKKNKDYFFTLLWTLKESYLKCIGTGINTKLNSISFVQNNKLLFNNFGYKFRIIKIKNYVISICLGE